MKNPLNIIILGCGPIAQYVFDEIRSIPEAAICGLVCRSQSVEKATGLTREQCPVFTTIQDIPSNINLVVDCAGHRGLTEHAPTALAAGIDVVTISTGALADPNLATRLDDAARQGKAKLKLLSGAVGGIDALMAGGIGELHTVTYTGRKPPRSWSGSPAQELCDLDKLSKPFTHFSGTAREAAILYPKNANVAATIALAGLGMDQTQVELVADPGLKQNVHMVSATGEFGSLQVKIASNPLENNPKSSALAAMSIVREIRQRTESLGF